MSFTLSDQVHVRPEDMSWQERVCFDHTELLSSASFMDGHK